jgi:hypothetical protein
MTIRWVAASLLLLGNLEACKHSAPNAPLPGRDGAPADICAIDSDCTLTVYDRPVTSSADCYCNDGCGNAVAIASAQAFEAQWHQFCDHWAGAKSCIAPPCEPPGPAGCEGHQCSELDPSRTTGSLACEPLAAHDQPIALETVVAVGRHADGTLYVIEQTADSQYRVFASRNGALWRQRIGGSGEINMDGKSILLFTASDDTGLFSLELETATSGSRRMGVVRGGFSGPQKTFVIGQQGDELVVVGADALAGLAIHNLPGEVVVEHQARLQDGRRLLVSRPRDDWNGTFRLFLGTNMDMRERRVTNTAISSTTTIFFILDLQEASVHFPSVLSPGDTAWFKDSGVTQPITELPPDAPTADLMFLCRGQ